LETVAESEEPVLETVAESEEPVLEQVAESEEPVLETDEKPKKNKKRNKSKK
jgi:hypothetical protein